MSLDSGKGEFSGRFDTGGEQYAYASGFAAGNDLWMLTDGSRLWFADGKARRESFRLLRSPLMDAASLHDALADQLALRDVWPTLAEYGEMPEGDIMRGSP